VVEKTLLFVAGGWASESDSLNSTELFDGTRWDQSVPMVVKRQNSRCHQIGDRIFACGGAEDGSVEVLDMRGVVKKWALVAPMPTPRQMFGTTACRGHLYLIGGMNDEDDTLYEVMERYCHPPSLLPLFALN
jgi:hypothetical protein